MCWTFVVDGNCSEFKSDFLRVAKKSHGGVFQDTPRIAFYVLSFSIQCFPHVICPACNALDMQSCHLQNDAAVLVQAEHIWPKCRPPCSKHM